MIYNVSYRTDVPAFYWDWWCNRVKDGFFDVRNPYYPEKVSRQSLNPDIVDGIQYISKNFEPVLHGSISIEELCEMYPTRFEVTINPYGKDIEPNVPHTMTERIEILKELRKRTGDATIIWNYNPILIDAKHTLQYHLQALQLMFDAIAPHVDAFSFDLVNMYEKTKRNAPTIRRPTESEQAIICDEISDLLAQYDMMSHTCDPTRVRPNIPYGKCNTILDFAKIKNRKPKPRLSEKTLNDCSICGTIAHRDVGTYNTCQAYCTYCYATENVRLAKQNYKKYDPKSTILCDTITDNNILMTPKATVYTL